MAEQNKSGNLLKTPRVFSLISLIFEKKCDKSKFSVLARWFKHFSIKIQHSMREKENKRHRIYDLLNAETKPQFLF